MARSARAPHAPPSRALRRGRRTVALVAFVLVVASSVASACDDPTGADLPAASPFPDGGGVAKAECPAALPVEGAECLLPEGTTCAFDVCSGKIARCAGGVWRRAANAPSRAECPDPPPGPGDPCPPCWSPSAVCTYGASCSSPDAGERRALAQCAGGTGATWEVTFEVCRDGASGPDVQGDADADSG